MAPCRQLKRSTEFSDANKCPKSELEIFIRSTYVMVISGEEMKAAVNIKINGGLLERVKSFRYLGHTIIENGKCVWNGN